MKTRWLKKLFLLSFVSLIFVSGLLGATQIGIRQPSAYSPNRVSEPLLRHNQPLSNSQNKIYAWFFGYIGDTFYPEYQLGINQTMMINLAQNLSKVFGKNNLILSTAVDEVPSSILPNGDITASAIPAIKSYIADLHKYASAVYGRLQFDQFSLTSNTTYGDCTLGGGSGPWYDCPVYNQTRLYIDQLGLNGIWFDIDVQYYHKIGATLFNEMMQNLTELFPNATFALNEAPASLGSCQGNVITCNEVIIPLAGYTWENQTYVVPTTNDNATSVDLADLQVFNQYYPGHVLMHFDGSGPFPLGNETHPMAQFADLSNSQEISDMLQLMYQGFYPALPNESYDMVIPIVGSWQMINSTTYGVLYNSLDFGNYARSTLHAFEQAALESLQQISFSEKYSSSLRGSCSIPVAGPGDELVVGVSVESTNSNPVSVIIVNDNGEDQFKLQTSANSQNTSSEEFVLASIYSSIALNEENPLKIGVTFSAPAKTHVRGYISCYLLIGNYTDAQESTTFGSISQLDPTVINATAFTPISNSFELAVAALSPCGATCSLSPGSGYITNFMGADDQIAVGMEYLYPSGTNDSCGLTLSDFNNYTVGADACIAYYR